MQNRLKLFASKAKVLNLANGKIKRQFPLVNSSPFCYFSETMGILFIGMRKITVWSRRHSTLLRLLELAIFLYLFMFSLDLMGTGLKMFGQEFARSLIQTTANPFVGFFIGVLATSLIQSSSSTTSIVVGMVGGGVLGIESAIPIVMGANIGTSITNILASLPEIRRSNEFRRAFSAAIVHDFFNWLAVLVLFPIQLMTGFLGIAAGFLGEAFQNIGGLTFLSPVKALTHPPVVFLKESFGFHPWVLVILSLVVLLLSLKKMVDVLRALVVEKAEVWFDRYLFRTALRAFLVGVLLTVVVQSSSITTSLVVPMAGAGILSLRQIFPYTLGSNIGTTVTAILAALVTGNLAAIVVAFSHLLFNLCGIIIWWPLRAVPIRLAEKFSEYSMGNRIVPFTYIIMIFFVIPFLAIYFLR
jgi:sodium-dependent phosphate cotransporter